MDLDYDNPLISNGQKKTLGFRLRNCYSQHVRSITELKRILAGCIVEGPELVKTEIIENNSELLFHFNHLVSFECIFLSRAHEKVLVFPLF